MKNILTKFGINTDVEITKIYHSAWKIHDSYILKKSSDVKSLERSILLNELLLQENLPVIEYLKTSDDKLYIYADNEYYCLMKLINGNHIDPFIGDTTANGYLLGQIIARLHLSLNKIEHKIDCYHSYYHEEMKNWDLSLVNVEVINACRDFQALYDTLPRQLIHRDMHLANLMFDNGELVGYLDFDICQNNVRIFDLCYMGMSLLVGEYQNAERLSIWQTIFTNIIRGYNDIIPLKPNELTAIPMLCVVIELIFTCFFGQTETAKNCADMTEWLYNNIEKIPQSI